MILSSFIFHIILSHVLQKKNKNKKKKKKKLKTVYIYKSKKSEIKFISHFTIMA